MGKNHKKYDTSAISESITQLQRKRRDVENTIAKLDVAAEKDFYKEVLDEIDEHICAKRIEMLNMYKELKLKEQRRFNSGYLPFSLPRIEYERLTKDIPRWVVEPAARVRPKKTLMLASDEIEQPKSFRDIFYGYATSTYPFMEYKNSRDGDPICDQFRAMLAPRNTIVAMADGCNWGNAPAEAARRATKGFIDLIHRERERITDTNRLCNLFLSGLCAAHNAIIKGDDPDRLIGTTTLMGGMVLQLVGDEQETPAVVPDEEDDNDDDTPVVVSAEQLAAATPPAAARHWAFVLASVGDCKAFQFRTKTREIIELTPNSRNENACDATDCGGRLGPYIDGGPDLRNIGVFVSRCDEDDIVFICSDGVHDNFDPQHFGLSPREFGIDAEQWQDGEPEQVNAVKAKYRSARMLELLGDADVTPELITTRFINFCIDTTRSSQEFMQQNLGKKLPSDYTRFPGKMDHTTLIALRVREVSEQDISDARSPTNIDEQDSSASSTTTTTKQRPSSASVPIATASTTTDPSSSSSSPLSMSPTSTTIPIASATSADQQPPPSAKASDSIDRNTSLIRLSKSAALSIRTLVAKAKEGANLDEFAVAVNDSVAHTTALVELLSSFEEPQDVSMLTALSAKTIATAKVQYLPTKLSLSLSLSLSVPYPDCE